MAVEFLLQPFLLSGHDEYGNWEPRWTIDAILDDGSRYYSRRLSAAKKSQCEELLKKLDATQEQFSNEEWWTKISNRPYRFEVVSGLTRFPSLLICIEN